MEITRRKRNAGGFRTERIGGRRWGGMIFPIEEKGEMEGGGGVGDERTSNTIRWLSVRAREREREMCGYVRADHTK